MQARKQAFTNDSWSFPNKPKQRSFDNTFQSGHTVPQETITTLFGESVGVAGGEVGVFC